MSLVPFTRIPAADDGVWYTPNELGDVPDSHRWRAQWFRGVYDGDPVGIIVQAHPVLRLTPKGAWIYPYGDVGNVFFANDRQQRLVRRWVSNDGSSAWAKPTREEALHSLAVRLERWATHVRDDLDKILESADAIERLVPELALYADLVRRRFP
jgi:hypothetical protein